MSIIPLVCHAKNVGMNEFTKRYQHETQGFEELWQARQRTTAHDIAHFYQEHDKDIWRQAYLSRYDYLYKKKLLWVLHVARQSCEKSDLILDYGCGAGAASHFLITKGFRDVEAADIPSQTLEFVREELGKSLHAVHTIDSTLHLQENRYALILALDCLEHTVEPFAITKHLLDALRPGGVLMTTFPKEDDFSSTHTREAQEERPAVFSYLAQHCETIIPEFLYRKKS
jgi:2-polyprenyl-3-methyl-5-hydroxy-6-metoxy-1,4-benzoquinol methylase